MDIIAGVIAIALYLLVSGSTEAPNVSNNYKQIIVNSKFGHNETKVINNQTFTWVDQANVKLDQYNVIRDDVGRPYFVTTSGHIEIDTQKINDENKK